MSSTSSKTIGEKLRDRGISRRSFLKFCTVTTSLLALPPTMIARVASALENSQRQPVIWLSFQECTGCTESFTRADTSSIEDLIFDYISLDYHHTLQAAAGEAAESAREATQRAYAGEYILIVEGAIPLGNPGYSTIAGESNVDILRRAAQDAKAIIAVGTCASFGGLPHAVPNPTGAVGVSELVTDKPVVNISGCPPVSNIITSVIVHFLTFGTVPELDDYHRPLALFGDTIHSRCPRRPSFSQGLFAQTFDDDGAKQGHCLFDLGCKGMVTNNACATTKWNGQTSFPIESGHGCLGCAEPYFWDNGSFYRALFTTTTETLPDLGMANVVNPEGTPLSTETTFAGGVAVKEGEGNFHPLLTFRQSKEIEVRGRITVESAHVGQTVDILLVIACQSLDADKQSLPSYLMLNTQNKAVTWDGQLSELIPFQQVTLTATQEIAIYKGQLLTTGIFQVFFGYRLSNGLIISNLKSIQLTVTE